MENKVHFKLCFYSKKDKVRQQMDATEFLPGVFVGDQFIASDEVFFRKNNIVRVINCTETLPFYFPHLAQYFRIPIDDSPNEADNNVMAAYLPSALRFITEARPNQERGVLIHCHAGMSRSCTVAAGLLRQCCYSTIPHAIKALVEKREIAFFKGRYVNFEKALYRVFGK